MTFSTRLRRLRKRLNLTQGQAAAVLGISRRTLCYYEKGERLPPAERVLTQQQILAKLERLEKREK